jgi:uncharacterized membrane protein YhaH (DUF805 family)
MAFNITWGAYVAPNITGGFENSLEYVNSATAGYFGIGVLIMLWIILYMLFKRWGDMEAVTTSSFITMIVSGMFWSMSVITDVPFVVLIMITGASLLLLFRRTQ